MESPRLRVLIAKHGITGLSPVLKHLGTERCEVIALLDAPPLIRQGHVHPDFDICLVDFPTLRRAHRQHPEELQVVKRSAAVIVMLRAKHLSKVRSLSQHIDGLVIIDRLCPFISDSLFLARERHTLIPTGMMTSHAAERAKAAALATLSANEMTSLVHLGSAYTNKAIATAMNISEESTKGLVRNVLTKLNLTNRTEAAIFYRHLMADRGKLPGYEVRSGAS